MIVVNKLSHEIIRSRAPLRLGFAGGGTDLSPYCDVFGGFIMNATIDLYAYSFLEMRSDRSIRFEALDFNDSCEYRVGDHVRTPSSLSLHKGVYERMVEEFNNGECLPVTLTTYCESPPGSGLGASSTLTVAMIQAFAELLKLPMGEYDVAQLAYQIERNDLKLSGGKQDQYAATFGGFNFMEFYSDDRVIVNPLRIKPNVISELEASMVLYYTGMSRDSSLIVSQQSRNVASRKLESVKAMHEVKSEAVAMKESILVGDIGRFAEVMRRGWAAKKKTAIKVSNSEIDRIYDLAIKSGAHAGKISGAGGGGFMILISDPMNKPKLENVLRNEVGRLYTARFTEHGAISWKI